MAAAAAAGLNPLLSIRNRLLCFEDEKVSLVKSSGLLGVRGGVSKTDELPSLSTESKEIKVSQDKWLSSQPNPCSSMSVIAIKVTFNCNLTSVMGAGVRCTMNHVHGLTELISGGFMYRVNQE